MLRGAGERFGSWPLAAALACLAVFSARLAATRVYQVDECYSVAMARLVASGREAEFQTDPSAFSVALSSLSPRAERSRDLFSRARAAMLALFWLNLVLLAACTGERLASRRGLAALLAAATLAPLWDYGFEIRHDNVLLTGLLLTWYLLRVRPAGRRSYFAAGALAAGLLFVAFKAFAYALPLSAAFLAFPPPGHRAPRPALIASWAAGAAAALAAARWGYGALGLWPVYLAELVRMSAAAAGVRRMPPWEALWRFLVEAPLLLVLVVAAASLVARDARRRAATRGWDGGVPEAALVAGACAVLLVNPTPYAYNLLFVVPFAFLLVHRCADRLAEEHRTFVRALPLGGAFVLLAHGVPFAAAACWEAAWSNARQVELMDQAEALADSREPVLDGVGLVPTRPSVSDRWLLDTLNIGGFRDGSGPRMRDLLARNPAAVIIPNYRTDWLPAEDRAFIASRYVPLSDDFWVPGAVLPPGGGDFEAILAGRYRISALADSGLAEDGAGSAESGAIQGATLDGERFSGGVVALTAGRHRLRTGVGGRLAAVWTGPRLDRPPRLAWADRRRLFVDWY